MCSGLLGRPMYTSFHCAMSFGRYRLTCRERQRQMRRRPETNIQTFNVQSMKHTSASSALHRQTISM